MATRTYNIKYNKLVNCTAAEASSTTYNDGGSCVVTMCLKANDGYYFTETDGDTLYAATQGRYLFFPRMTKRVDAADDEQVKNGKKRGITSDGKYYCSYTTSTDPLVWGEMEIQMSATGKETVLNITNNVANTTYQKADSGSNTIITLTCSDGYVFDGVPTVSYGADPEDPFAEATTADMTVNGNVATFELASESYGGYATIDGKTKVNEVIPDTVNNVPNTTYTSEANPFADDGFDVTLTCSDGYVFDGTPTITYVDTTGNSVTENFTVGSDNNTATASIANVKYIATLDGKTKTKEVIPETVNNVHNTTYTSETDPFADDGYNVTLTCSDGYVFDGTPTITYVDTTGKTNTDNFTVDSDNTKATASIVNVKYIATLDGKTKKKVVVVTPNVVNQMKDVTESHTYTGNTLDVKLSSNKVMLNVKVAYTTTDGSTKTDDVNINVTVKPVVDADNVLSDAAFTLNDVDFTKPVTITGTAKKAIRVDYITSGCTPTPKPTYCFVGEKLDVTVKADSGNEFADASKCKIVGYVTFESTDVMMTVSEDKTTATGSITPTDDNLYIEVNATATAIFVPTAKYGFINAYVLNDDNLNAFATARFVPYTGSTAPNEPISYDLGDYVSRVKRFYFDVDMGSTSKLLLGNFQVDTTVHNLASDTKTISFGTVTIPNTTESTADYDTELTLFAPFIGLVSLPTDLIGCTVSLDMRVNLIGGSGVYVMMCDDRIVWSDEVTPCTDVLFRTQKQDVETVGGNNFDSRYLFGLAPYIVLQKKTVTSDGVVYGSDRRVRVGDCSGLCRFGDVQFMTTDNMHSTDMVAVRTVLASGIVL